MGTKHRLFGVKRLFWKAFWITNSPFLLVPFINWIQSRLKSCIVKRLRLWMFRQRTIWLTPTVVLEQLGLLLRIGWKVFGGWISFLKRLKMPNTMLNGWDLRMPTMRLVQQKRSFLAGTKKAIELMLWLWIHLVRDWVQNWSRPCCTMHLKRWSMSLVMSLLWHGI